MNITRSYMANIQKEEKRRILYVGSAPPYFEEFWLMDNAVAEN